MTINMYLVHMTHVLVSIHSLLNMDTSCKQDTSSLFTNLPPTVQPGKVVRLRTLALWVQLQMRDVLGSKTVVDFHVVLCATVVSPLSPFLSICATLHVIWRDPGSDNVEAVKIVETGVAPSHSVLLVSYEFRQIKLLSCVCWVISYNEIHSQSIKPQSSLQLTSERDYC